jgi:galactose mutarotase-like enzyme
MLTTISSPKLSADIHLLGAQLFALRDMKMDNRDGRDLQWNGDPAVWKGRAPILFPIIGALSGNQYCIDGNTYRLPRHGFARDRTFTLVEATTSHALFRLQWDEETLKVYPFHFALDMRFALDDAMLTITASVKNLETTQDLPASFGFHPALRWPLPYGQARADHVIVFEKDELAPIRRLDAEGLLLPDGFPSPIMQRELRLRDELFVDDAIVLTSLESRRVRYGAATGPAIEIAFPDTPQLGIWSKPGAGFICIEPWHGYADPQGFSGDFRTKRGIFIVSPGQTKVCTMAITLVDEGL